MESMNKLIAYCPDCQGQITFKKPPSLGQQINCRQCRSDLEVIRRSPIELDWVANPSMEMERVGAKHVKTKRRRVVDEW